MIEMEKLVSLCKRRGFLFQSSEIYGGLNGFWDYGPLGVELKRNIKDAWWRDMVTGHDDSAVQPGAPEAYEMTGLDCTIIMHPQVWKCSGHYDLFHDYMVDCRESKGRYRYDQVRGRWVECKGQRIFVATTAEVDHEQARRPGAGPEVLQPPRERRGTTAVGRRVSAAAAVQDPTRVLGPDAKTLGTLTEPREFNLMFETYTGAVRDETSKAFLRPETAQGIFVNFKNVLDSTRVRIPFGIAQIGKSFRNEITPRNFTFRSREFEQMEIEFFCHPEFVARLVPVLARSADAVVRGTWAWPASACGCGSMRAEELSHYSTGTADIEYAFPFLPPGEFGELEGIAHRGDFDLRSHMEGKLNEKTRPLQLELGPDGKPKWKGSGRDLTYRDDLTNERYTPHVIEPSAGADRATLAFLCEAYTEDQAPDENGVMKERVVMKFHPRLAPIKAAVFPLVKKDGMPEIAKEIYRALKPQFPVFYDEKGAVGRRYRRQDEAGTPYCITVDSQTLQDRTVTFRDRDTLQQWRVKVDDCVDELRQRLR